MASQCFQLTTANFPLIFRKGEDGLSLAFEKLKKFHLKNRHQPLSFWFQFPLFALRCLLLQVAN